MIDRWIELTPLLERETGVEWFMDGTPSVSVLYHRTAHGTLVGVDLESVVLYQDRGETEMPLDVIYLEHEGDAETIVSTVRMLVRMQLTPDMRGVVYRGV